ncbi:MAG TPA: HAMP domain-containing sensor histidine kinase [Actinomycetota bacterium]|nr:HAMP domain-containing sensor histidine kinase [Actinomycetota bacterium]
MTRLRPLAMLLALVLLGAGGALLVAAALGMNASEVAHLAGLLAPAVVVTVAAATLASSLLRRTSLRQRYLAIAAVGTLVALGNLFALTQAMFVSARAATVLAVVLTYASAAGLAAAHSSARSSVVALDRATGTARIIGDGDLAARVGPLEAGPELDRLAATIDQMAARLEAVRDQEQRVEQTRRDLVTAVSHDLRTPLANLRVMVEAIDEQVVTDPPTMRRYAADMRRAVGQLTSLVNDLFELVQIDAGAIEAEIERAQLADVITSAIATVEVEAARKGVVLSADVRGTEATVCSPHVSRVLQNLLVNAVRHTPADGTIHVEGRRDPDSLRLVVHDTGEGIAETDLPHIFDPFFRADAARSGDGAGLGLALADRIVRALGGTIEVASHPDRGTRFAVTLPLDRKPGLTAVTADPGPARTRSGGRRGSGSRHPS